MQKLRTHGRFIVASITLAIAFVLSVQFSDRGVEFDLRNSPLSASERRDDSHYDLASLKILNRVLLQIKDNYFDPDRIDPNKMLVYALDEIQNSIPEVVVEFDKDKNENPKIAKVSVDRKTKRFEIGKTESLWEMSFRLKEVFSFVQANFEPDDDLNFKDIEYAAINGMLSTLDPHSSLLPPKHYEEMQTQTGGKFGGLGIVISVRDGNLTVISPIDGTPAARKGIKSRDKIMRIGEESTINMNLSEAVNMLRGEPGTPVDLHILRKGWDEPRKFTVTRAVIKIDSVDSQPLANRVGYLRIKNFQANTASDMKTHLAGLKKKMGGLQGLVLDLRDNPGGLLDQAIRVSDFFLDEGTIVSTVGVGNRLREKRAAKATGTEPPYPIIILMNAGSASASEIVAGALQNHDRAVVLGDQSFGKGSVQVLTEFPDSSALKLTVAQYLTPGEISIQGKGINPDISVFPVIIAKDEVDLYASENIVRERDLNSHLTNTATVKPHQAFYDIRFLDEELSKRVANLANENTPDDDFDDPEKFKEDFEIKLAQRLLTKTRDESVRPKMLQKLKRELDATDKHEVAIMQRELRKLGIDWSKGNSPATAKLDVKLETSKEGALVAGDKVRVIATVTNRGSETIHQLKAISTSDNGLFDEREFIFGAIAPGETREYGISVQIPKDVSSRHDLMEFKFSNESRKYSEVKARLELKLRGNDLPKFAFSYDIQDESGDGQLVDGESASLRVFVRNVGQADSEETIVYLKNMAFGAVYLKKGRAKIKSIKKDEQTMVEFDFKIKAPPKEGATGIDLEIDVYDTMYRQLTQKKFTLPYVSTDKTATKSSGQGVVISKEAIKLHVAATSDSDVAAVAAVGAVLPIIGKVVDWVKVDLEGRDAWIPAVDVKVSSGSATLAGVRRVVMFQPPAVDIEPSSMMTSSSKVTLKGAARDDAGVKDYYIFVYNRADAKVNTRKLNYVRGQGGEQLKINADVPLFKGMNRIAIVARDKEGMSTTTSTYVYRK